MECILRVDSKPFNSVLLLFHLVLKVFSALLLTLLSALVVVSCVNQPMESQNMDGFLMEETDRKILVTIEQSAHHERGLLNSFSSINYQRGRYATMALSVRRTLDDITENYQLTEIGGWDIKPLNVYCAVMVLPKNHSVSSMLQQLKDDPRVESAQPLYGYAVQALKQKTSKQYNDPYYPLQYKGSAAFVLGFHQWSTGQGIDVAIIDTGIDRHHPELQQQITEAHNFVGGSDEQFNTDIHGTAVAGIIAAQANNHHGIVGLAPDATLWALKACWQLEPQSSTARCNSFTLASALSFAIDHDIDIINISLAGPFDPLIARLVTTAIRRGIIVVAADPVVTTARFPAQLRGVIAVREKMVLTAGSKNNDSNSNSKGHNNSTVSVNGREVLSTGPGGGYGFFSGPSMSAATVSAYAALLHQKKPKISTVKRILFINSAVDLNSKADDSGIDQFDQIQSLLLSLE